MADRKAGALVEFRSRIVDSLLNIIYPSFLRTNPCVDYLMLVYDAGNVRALDLEAYRPGKLA